MEEQEVRQPINILPVMRRIIDVGRGTVLAHVEQIGTGYDDDSKMLNAIGNKNLRRAVEVALEKSLLTGRHQGMEFVIYSGEMDVTEHEAKGTRMLEGEQSG